MGTTNESADTGIDAGSSTGPLHGIKVLDLSVMISGPLAAMMLADQGADVIKIESPGLGDIMRFLGTSKGGMTGIFANNNRGKRSLVVDLKQDAGRDIVTRLIADADVLIQNFRPGAMERIGLGWDEVHRLNPDLVYASISGYGPDGPSSDRRAYDNVIQASSGLAHVQGNPATGAPELFRTLVCDKTTAYTVAQAITAALFARATGKARGQHVVVAMLDTAIAFMWPDSAMDAVVLDDDALRTPTIAANYNVIPLADGFGAASAVTDSEFAGLCASYGRADLATDERFSTLAARTAHLGELADELLSAAAATSVADFVAGSIKHDVPASKVVSLDELPHDPQVINNGVFVEREHPSAGRLREPRPAARMSATPQRVSGHAPMYGQHSDEIVTELGLDAASLRDAGTIA
jgi:crotonobetainyl-CoA:carnitine CoA-transferase CaiB-like acyl-CoA transferase